MKKIILLMLTILYGPSFVHGMNENKGNKISQKYESFKGRVLSKLNKYIGVPLDRVKDGDL